MDKKEYLKSRDTLMTEAKDLLAAGGLDEARAKKAEIEQLDASFEEAAKKQANAAVLAGAVDALNLDLQNIELPREAVEIGADTMTQQINYEDVFAKVALKRELTQQEIDVYNRHNPSNVYTHTAANTEIVIPTTVVAGINSLITEAHPILADVIPTKIKGTVKYAKQQAIVAGDANYYAEGTDTDDEQNDFGALVLSGKELSKAVTVSWKLQAMAIEDFIPFIQRELAERLGYAKARAFVRGAGDTQYPQGVITAIAAEAGTPQKVSYQATGLTYDDMTNAMSKIKSAYIRGAKIYASNSTVWTALAGIKDTQGRPIFIPDVSAGGVGRIFGLPVLEEDALNQGEIIIGNMSLGYRSNVQEDMRLVTEQHAKGRKTDFVAYEVNDGGVYDTKAYAYLVKGV